MQSVELAYEDGPKENQIIHNDTWTATYKTKKMRNYIYKLALLYTPKNPWKFAKLSKKIKRVQIPRIPWSLSANMSDFITHYTYFKNMVLTLNFMGGSKSLRTNVKEMQ